MHLAVFVPLLASAGVLTLLLPVLAGAWADHLPPRAVAWTLALGSAVLAVAWVGALALLAASAGAQTAVGGRVGHWPVGVLETEMPWARPVGAVAGVLLLLSLVRLVRTARTLLGEYRAESPVPGPGSAPGFVVIEDDQPIAYARPGHGGATVVVSRGMLGVLTATEVRVLLAHETAHLRARHHVFLTAVALAVAANPLLAPVRADLAHALERWADEVAATEVASRSLVARAIGRAALAARGPTAPPVPALGITSGRVPRRVAVLLGLAGGPSWRSRGIALAVLAAGLVTAFAMVHAAVDFSEMVSLARIGVAGV